MTGELTDEVVNEESTDPLEPELSIEFDREQISRRRTSDEDGGGGKGGPGPPGFMATTSDAAPASLKVFKNLEAPRRLRLPSAPAYGPYDGGEQSDTRAVGFTDRQDGQLSS